MLAGNYDLSAEQNSSYEVIFQYVDENDDSIDILSEYDNVKFIVRKSAILQDKNLFEIHYSGTVDEGYLEFTDTETSYGTLTVSSDTITTTVSSNTMSSVNPGNYFYYLYLTQGEELYCLVKGRFIVEAP